MVFDLNLTNQFVIIYIHSRSSSICFLLESAYLLLLFFPCVEWIRYIKIIFLSVWIYLFHLVFSRRRLSAVITAVVCEGKVPRIDNEQDEEEDEALKIFFYLHTWLGMCLYNEFDSYQAHHSFLIWGNDFVWVGISVLIKDHEEDKWRCESITQMHT
jgi:hypothetical protein